jgi:hypothetical protein
MAKAADARHRLTCGRDWVAWASGQTAMPEGVKSHRFIPYHVFDFRIGSENLLQGVDKARKLGRGIYLFEKKLPHGGSRGIGETQEFIIGADSVAAANCESEFLIFHGDIPAPILPIDLLSADASFGELLDQIFGQAFSPYARVDPLLFAFVWGELG